MSVRSQWLGDGRPEPAVFKAWFREIDKDRNGMIDEAELHELIKRGDQRMSKKEVHQLFRTLDTDQSGSVPFDEFINFIFEAEDDTAKALRPKRRAARIKTNALESIKVKAQFERGDGGLLAKVQIFGASLDPSLNSSFEVADKHQDESAEEDEDEDFEFAPTLRSSLGRKLMLNDHPVFLTTEPAKRSLFYGWDAKKIKIGWYLANAHPAEGEPIVDYLAFNPSPLATAPQMCYACWELKSGQRDKRMCCEAGYGYQRKKGSGQQRRRASLSQWERVSLGMSEVLDEELWEVMSSSSSDHESTSSSSSSSSSADDSAKEEEDYSESPKKESRRSLRLQQEEGSSEEDAPLQHGRTPKGDLPKASARRSFLSGGVDENRNSFDAGSSTQAFGPLPTGNWEQAWGIETGEEAPMSESEDSDAYLTALHEQRMKDLEEARTRREMQERLAREKMEKFGEDSEDEPESDDEEKKEWAKEERRRKRLQREADALARRRSVEMAPGFEVKEATPLVKKSDKKKERRKRRQKAKMGDRTGEGAGGAEDGGHDPLEQYREEGLVDLDFPPNEISLGDTWAKVDQWIRLPKLHASPCLFRRILPDDIFYQSNAGNMWFLSACAAVAEYPAWVASMFGRRTMLTRKNRYSVRLYHPGKRQFVRVIVDDLVPTASAPNHPPAPCFAGISADGAIWIALVEKAFAKFCGSYAKTDWGEVAYGMYYLCGGAGGETWERISKVPPGRGRRTTRWKRSSTAWKGKVRSPKSPKSPKVSRDFLERESGEGFVTDGVQRDQDEIWRMLRRYMERCYPVACGVDPRRTEDRSCGLQTDRMYSLISTREVPAKPNTVLRMVVLRNPFDVGEWTGRWSDESKAWAENPHAVEYVNFRPGADGTFFMSYTDFLKYFTVISCVRKSMPVQGSHRAKLVGLKKGLLTHQR